LRPSWKVVQNRTPGTLNNNFSCFLIMICFTVNPIIFGGVWTAKKYVICWNIKTYQNMDVKLLHPVWKDVLDTVNTVVLTGYWKHLIIVLFVIQCFFQNGSECGSWTKIIGNSSLVIHKIHLDLFMIIFICNVIQWWHIYWCALLRGHVSKQTNMHWDHPLK
jgi:hypothetical protein